MIIIFNVMEMLKGYEEEKWLWKRDAHDQKDLCFGYVKWIRTMSYDITILWLWSWFGFCYGKER